MRIFYAFLIIFVSVILWTLPITQMVYDYRTDQRTDTYSTDTAVGVTSANETLLDDLYGCDMGSIDIDSTLATDAPLPNSVNCTNRVLNITGLTANTTRTLDITYDYDALEGNNAIDTLLGWIPYINILIIVCFPIASILAMWKGWV